MTTERRATRRIEERVLIGVGMAGLGLAVAVACSDDDRRTPAVVVDAGAGDGGTTAPSCASTSTTAAHTAEVVTAANALLATLPSAQTSAIQYDRTLANAQKWSNLPVGAVARNGVRFGDMSSEAQAAAMALANVAAGSTGAKLLAELRAADQWLVTDGKASSNEYGSGLYYVALHGTPSTTSVWMLQIGGHHLAYNFTYNGRCTSATPLFDGAEPMAWTGADGAHEPLAAQQAAMRSLLASIGSIADAKLSGTFSDLVNAPTGGGGPGGGSSGGGDTKYPSSLTYPTSSSGRGVAVSSLSAEQKQLVKSAIEAWVKNVAEPVSAALLAEYESDAALAQTYVGYSGSTDLSTQSSYVRIDGPRVWIELSVQGGVIYRNVVHNHTLWRDKAADYGAEFAAL